jgi:hypothetical protein
MSIAMSSSVWPATPSETLAPRLLRAYRATRYRAGGCAIRIGRRSDAALDARCAVLLTAWNPQSRHMPRGWNQRMQCRLRAQLRRFRVVEADGSLHGWHEAMLLVVGPEPPLLRLASRFRQRAVVILRRGQPARLRVLGGGPG